eukprot:TRINITY_DN1108_c0_g1_i1.p1 TRINITY_DN1108_c0_g1~~TRINITY_DN1108_c0_g1_i1.p1  ORF type:complete len:161 (-),score=16.64 TRINITY_DN1108_c0_g1_i1:293-775(-)
MCIRDSINAEYGNLAGSSMQLLLSLPSSSAIPLSVQGHDTVHCLAQAVADNEGQGLGDFYLSFGSKTLHDPTATLDQCGIVSGSAVHARLRINGGGNGLRAAARVTQNAGLILRRTDSTMLSQDSSGRVVLVPSPRIAHKRMLCFSKKQVIHHCAKRHKH